MTITLFSSLDATFVILKVTGELFTGGSPTWGTQLAQTTLDILGLVRLECSIVRLMEQDDIGHDEHWDASRSGASAVVLLFRFCCTVPDRGVRPCRQLKKNYHIQKTTRSNNAILLEEDSRLLQEEETISLLSQPCLLLPYTR
jgi:hypothetical protein